jgi:uncharacterized protein
MDLSDERESENVEDRRGMGGGGGGRTMLAGGGLGTLVIVLLVSAIFGVNPLALLQQMPQGGGGGGIPGGGGAQLPQGRPVDPNDPSTKFIKRVLATTEDVWQGQFQRLGGRYKEPRLVLFSGAVDSACGMADAAVGPFYCPGDEQVYLDLSFFDELAQKLRAPGDFAQAYVVAHEIGHHVQKLRGISDQVDAARRRVSEREANRLSVRLELQADFYAGVWAHDLNQMRGNQMRSIIQPGDIDEALRAASQIGDDRLQKQGRGYVVPDSFTHGSSEQRVRWFKKGFETGDIKQGDTFNTDDL